MRRVIPLLILLAAAPPAIAQTVRIVGIKVSAPVCGDSHIDAGEQCDTLNMGSYTCASFSCSGGTPTCNGSCVAIATGCSGCSTGDLLDEAFTAAAGAGQTDGTTLGFDDATWTRSGDGASSDKPVPNPNETAGCPTTTGWGGECLKLAVNPNLNSFHNTRETNAFTSTTTGVWFHARLKLSYTIATDAHAVDVVALGPVTSYHAAGSIYLEVNRATGPTYTLRLVVQGGAIIGTGYAIANGESLCVEMYLSSSTSTAQWWVNGTDMGQGTDAALVVAPTNLWLGVAAAPSSTDNETQYWDQVQISSTGRLACN